jgi:hypothetical protein
VNEENHAVEMARGLPSDDKPNCVALMNEPTYGEARSYSPSWCIAREVLEVAQHFKELF